MTQFMGTHQNRLDAKGRVSIPASFRTVLRGGDGDGAAALVLRPSHKHPCIEGWPPAVFAALSSPLQAFDLFSEDQDDLAAALFADAWPMEADKEGRIVLPENLKAHAGLSDSVVFMGLGATFQIWEPMAAEQRRAAARERVRARGLTLPGVAA
jgi:MraZ protein